HGNDLSGQSVRVVESGGTSFKEGDVILKPEYKEANEAAEAAGKDPAKSKKPRPARAKTLLLGITKASLQSESFISAASFQETTKVLTEAALAGAVDMLVGLKENVILGHLIPAGTAFNPHLNLRIKHLAEPPAIVEPEPRAAAAPTRTSSRARNTSGSTANPSMTPRRSGANRRRRCTGSKSGTRCWSGTVPTASGSSAGRRTSPTTASIARSSWVRARRRPCCGK